MVRTGVITQAKEFIADFHSDYVIADTSYDAKDFLTSIAEQGATPVIPPRANRKVQRKYDKHLYKERHLAECFINKIMHYRRIFSRFEKLSKRYLAFSALWVLPSGFVKNVNTP
ncbi:MAG: transposase [Anaerolineae bacterium]|nr:transposase [Anaerolineae bacterium]